MIAISTTLRRSRGRLSLLLAVVLLSATVVTAHSAMGAGHMGASSMSPGHVAGGSGADAAIAMCLAVIEATALVTGAALLGRAMRSHDLLPGTATTLLEPTFASLGPLRARRARPPDLSVLQVFRR